eukprot:5812901-Amphidinium_carterae.6
MTGLALALNSNPFDKVSKAGDTKAGDARSTVLPTRLHSGEYALALASWVCWSVHRGSPFCSAPV